MAYYDDPGTEGPYTQGEPRRDGVPRLGVLVNWAGAVVSLGLVIGTVVWAYQLSTRDVSGVPVIRALEGPMRVAPADPGGTQAAHQGLAVNRIAEGADSAPVPDRLILAPPPVELDAVALASASASASAYVRAAADLPEPAPDAETAAAAEPILLTPAAVGESTQALIERLMSQADTPAAHDPAPEEAVASTGASAAVIPASVPGPARSLRPETRPEAVRARAASTPAPADTRADVTEMDPAGLPEGTRLVQLGAFDTPDLAREEWGRLATRFPDYFAGRARVVEEANAGGSPFFRLRAHGFEDLAASRRFCAVLMAQSAPCVPVTVR